MKSGEGPEPPIYESFIAEVIKPIDPCAWKIDEAKKEEIEVIIKRGTRKIVCRADVPDDAYILGGIFAFAIKD